MKVENVVTIDGEPPIAIGIARDGAAVVVIRVVDEEGHPKGAGLRLSEMRARAFVAGVWLAIEKLARGT